jgi:hypothetical protein
MFGHPHPFAAMLVVAICCRALEPASAQTAAGGQNQPAKADITLQDAGADCLSWTNGCVNCVRSKAGDGFTCNNIGIACQPREGVCLNRTKPDTK